MWDGVWCGVGRETVVSMGHLNCDGGVSNGACVNSGLDVMKWLRETTEKPSWWAVSREGFGITGAVLLSGAGLGKTDFGGQGFIHGWECFRTAGDGSGWGRSWRRVAHYWREPQGSGGISVTAWMERDPGSQASRRTTKSSKAQLLPVLVQRKVSPCRGGFPESNNSHSSSGRFLQRKCYSLASLCSTPPRLPVWSTERSSPKPHSRDLFGGKNPGGWLPLLGWKKAVANWAGSGLI